MTTAAISKPATKEKAPAVLEKAIADQVINQLGKPKDLHKIQVKLYEEWNGKARVNIWRTLTITMKNGFGLPDSTFERTQITDSFFLTFTPTGEIAKSSPAITKTY